jgi:hypothetical protein
MKKKQTAKRSTRAKLSDVLGPTTKAEQRRATEGMTPYLDEVQDVVDDQTLKDLGLFPQSTTRAAKFRKEIDELREEGRKAVRGKKRVKE